MSEPNGAGLFQRARQAARRWNQDTIDTEHVLLGLLDEPDSDAVRLLRSMGYEPDAIRREVERRMQMGTAIVPEGQLPMTQGVRRVLDRALSLARRRGGDEVGSVHVLHGLASVRGTAARALAAIGVARGLHRKAGRRSRTLLWVVVVVAGAVAVLLLA